MTVEPVETENESEARATTRRGVLAGAGMVGATALLTACGSETTTGYGSDFYNGNQPGSGATGGSSDGGTEDPSAGGGEAAQIVAVADVPVGGGYIDAENDIVVTQPIPDEWHAFSATCTHQGCPVSSVEGGTINCNCHNSKFSETDGSVVAGPAPAGLSAKEVTVQDGFVVLA